MVKTVNITMGTGFALSVNPEAQGIGDQLILAALNRDSGLQQWQWLYMPDQKGCFLYNPSRDMVAAPKSVDEGAPMLLYPRGLEPSDVNTFAVPATSPSAITTKKSDKYNLNAFGKDWGPGTKVGLWGWSKGQANEVWKTIPVA